MTTPTRVLEDLLRRCTLWPWSVALNNESEKWQMFANPDGYKQYVASELPAGMSNYDMRLWAMAPELAKEVLALRKALVDKA